MLIREIIIYGFVGLAALFIQSVTYIVLCNQHMSPIVANFIGWTLGLIVAYVGHTRYTFQKTHKFLRTEFIKFLISALIGLAINTSGVYLLVNMLKFSSYIGLIPMFISPIVTFLISKFWTFK